MKKLICLVFLCSIILHAQSSSDKLTINGDTGSGYVVNGESIREIIGNVKIRHGDILINCKKAIQNLNKNRVDLFGNVHIIQDTINIYTEEAVYFGDEEYAYTDTFVTLKDPTSTLSSDKARYFFEKGVADFFGNVRLKDSLRTILSDRLHYLDEKDKIIAAGNVAILDSSSILLCDSLEYKKTTGTSFALGNVYIKALENDLIITGNELIDLGTRDYTRITGDPTLIKIDTTETGELDTLIIKSKTMETLVDSVSKLIASDSVKILKGDFSSVNQYSIYFRKSGKIITQSREKDIDPPVIWNDNTQVVGDTIIINLVEEILESIDIINNAIIISENDIGSFRYNQITGSTVQLQFKDDHIERTHVSGGMLSIYYMFEELEPAGLIKSSAEEAKIYFDKNRVVDVKLYGSPESEFHPENLINGNEKDFTLPGFFIYKNKPNKNFLLRNTNIQDILNTINIGVKRFDTK